jgi:hypothetical protein
MNTNVIQVSIIMMTTLHAYLADIITFTHISSLIIRYRYLYAIAFVPKRENTSFELYEGAL